MGSWTANRQARGTGVVGAVLAAVEGDARARGWAAVNWITAADNVAAQKVYDRFAQRTSWLMYEWNLLAQLPELMLKIKGTTKSVDPGRPGPRV